MTYIYLNAGVIPLCAEEKEFSALVHTKEENSARFCVALEQKSDRFLQGIVPEFFPTPLKNHTKIKMKQHPKQDQEIKDSGYCLQLEG